MPCSQGYRMCRAGAGLSLVLFGWYAYMKSMRITDESLAEFIRSYADEFGETLTQDKAREIASNVLDLYLRLATPTPEEIAAMEKERGAGSQRAA